MYTSYHATVPPNHGLPLHTRLDASSTPSKNDLITCGQRLDWRPSTLAMPAYPRSGPLSPSYGGGSVCVCGRETRGVGWAHHHLTPHFPQRGRRCLAEERDVPAAWLETCARPGRLLASLARPPLVRSWWMAVVLLTPVPVETTGTARTRVPLPAPSGPRTWAFPPVT